MEQITAAAQAALNVAKHIHDTKFDGIIVSGGSHEISRGLFALAWGALYPGTRLPHEYVLDEEANALLYKRHATAAYPKEFEEWMSRKIPDLAAAKEQSLCFLDDFALSGEKYRGVGFALRLLGYTNIRFAYFAAKEDTELGKNAFVGERSTELVSELRHLGQHIQGKADAIELLDGVAREAHRLRAEAIDELRDVGLKMKQRNR